MKSNQIQMEESVKLWKGLSCWTLNKNVPVVWWSIRHELSMNQIVSGRGDDMWTRPESLSCTQVCSFERVSERRTDELSVYLQAERLRGRSSAEHALIEKVDKQHTHTHTRSAWSLWSRAAHLKTADPMLQHRLTATDSDPMRLGRVCFHKLSCSEELYPCVQPGTPGHPVGLGGAVRLVFAAAEH